MTRENGRSLTSHTVVQLAGDSVKIQARETIKTGTHNGVSADPAVNRQELPMVKVNTRPLSVQTGK